jgi:hypothetical protein
MQDVTNARKDMNVLLKPKEGKKGVELTIPDQDFCYGKPTKPPTPIKQVVGNFYGENAESSSIKKYQDLNKIVSPSNQNLN